MVSRAGFDEGADLLDALPGAALTLEDGVRQAGGDGFVISAKFEMNDAGDALSLSVYTARGGRDTMPEQNQLAELAGDPTGSAWAPGAEVFGDTEHIARASEQLTLMALTSATLDSVIRAASADGVVYRVEPAIADGRAVFDVLVVTTAGGAEELTLR